MRPQISPPSLRRQTRLQLLERMAKNAICAEVGVWKGDFSRTILRYAQPLELHLVDPWLFAPEFPERWYGGGWAKSQQDMDAIYNAVVDRFRSDRRVIVHRLASAEAARHFPDRAFDWIYLDANHSYAEVLTDLANWSAKLKVGGVLAGDDWHWRDERGRHSVQDAVKKFVNDSQLSLELLPNSQYIISS